MMIDDSQFEIRLARSEDDLMLAQRLRYDVFVDELGGDGPLVDHNARRERDQFDPFFDHLMLFDRSLFGNQCVGVYRLMRQDQAQAAGQFYSDSEFDLGPLRRTGQRLLELGRSCLHRDYRGGTAMMHLWTGLADYVEKHQIDLLFGVASFHGTDLATLAKPLSFLHHRHLAPPEIRVKAHANRYQPMDMISEDELDRVEANRAIPSLIKAYLRMGGFVGDGAYVDHAFNTTDVCLLMDVTKVSKKHLGLYTQSKATA